MSWFKRKPKVEAPSFDEWMIQTPDVGGLTMEIRGYVMDAADSTALLSYVQALADGLRSAGFQSEVTLTRKTEVRP